MTSSPAGRATMCCAGSKGSTRWTSSWTDLFTWIFAGTQSAFEPHAGMANTAVGGDIGEDDIFGFERFITSDFGNQIYGSQRSEEFIAGNGDDEIWPKGCDDVVFGGAGRDAVSFADAPRGIQLDLRQGTAHGDGDDQVAGIESVEGSIFGDSIFGNGADNLLLLAGGDDVGHGRWGADTLDGGSGDDVLIGGPGSDTLDGDWGDDSVAGGPGADTIAGGRGMMDRCRTDPTDSVNSCELPW